MSEPRTTWRRPIFWEPGAPLKTRITALLSLLFVLLIALAAIGLVYSGTHSQPNPSNGPDACEMGDDGACYGYVF